MHARAGHQLCRSSAAEHTAAARPVPRGRLARIGAAAERHRHGPDVTLAWLCGAGSIHNIGNISCSQ